MTQFALFLWLLVLIPLASAQQYTISTVAGFGLLPFGGAGAPGVSAFLIAPNYVAADSSGNTFVSDTYYQQVFRIDANGIISVYAGTGQQGYRGDGGPATAALLNSPAGLAFDSTGNLYIADESNAVVRKVSPSGVISTVAGSYTVGYFGDGGSATSAALGDPEGVAVDAAGNLYISQGQYNVVRMVRPNGMISTFAGTGVPGFSGDGGPASAAQLSNPLGLTVDTAGNLYVADNINNRIRQITPQGAISTVAGDGIAGMSGNGGPATAASIFLPVDMAVDAQGNMYIADSSNFLIRMVTPAGVIQPFAGGGASVQDGPANQADLEFPTGLAIDNSGNIVVALNAGRQVRRMTPQGAIATIAGVVPTISAGDNIAAASAPLFYPYAVAPDGAGNVYISDFTDNRIRIVSPSGLISTFAGNGLLGDSTDNSPATEMGGPRSLAFDGSGNLYVSLGSGFLVQRITPNGIVNTVAGGGPEGTLGDGGSAVEAGLDAPYGIVLDGAGNLYIAEHTTNRIRRVDTTGTITTIAGTGVAGYSGDNGPATAAELYQPYQIAFDSNGNLYVADAANNRVREITPGGTITTVAGTGVRGGTGDGGVATKAQLASPTGVAVDAAGNLYIADSGNSKIRVVNAVTGVIKTIAGTGNLTFSGDGGPATAAALNGPLSLAIDASGDIYFTDVGNYRVRMLTPVP